MNGVGDLLKAVCFDFRCHVAPQRRHPHVVFVSLGLCLCLQLERAVCAQLLRRLPEVLLHVERQHSSDYPVQPCSAALCAQLYS